MFRFHQSGVRLRLLLWVGFLSLGLLLMLGGVPSAGAATAAATPTPPRPAATATRPAAGSASATGTLTATTPAALDARAAAGRQVYLQNYCGICHTLAAAGTNGTFGPPHNGIATTAKQRITDPNYTGKAVTVVQYLRESLVEPQAYAAPGYAYTSHPMPTYAHLPKSDLNALIYFLLQQK